MGNKPFKFKQFTIAQDKCAMKVGTDGVLLGAWSSLANKPEAILDIGTGSGLIALMLAQRSTAELIDAIEIDEHAYEQCVQNFENSDWGDRLFCYHAGFDEFFEEIEETYDLIVSNPPFYEEQVSSGDKARDMARMSAALPLEELLFGVSRLLAPDGVFTIIIPSGSEEKIKTIAALYNLHPNKITRVKGNTESEVKRCLLAFSFGTKEMIVAELIIEEERHQYTDAYIKLTKEFYLKM